MATSNCLEKKDGLNFHIPRWKELPDIDLYLDQVVTVLEKYLADLNCNKDDKIITKTMINNYVKHGILKPPVQKKYNREHVATLFIICILKQVYSINDIGALINLSLDVATVDMSYNYFCVCLERAVNAIFQGREFVFDRKMNEEKYLLKNVVLSFANKLFVQKHFLNNTSNMNDK